MMTKTNAIAVSRGIGRITVASCGRHPRCHALNCYADRGVSFTAH